MPQNDLFFGRNGEMAQNARFVHDDGPNVHRRDFYQKSLEQLLPYVCKIYTHPAAFT